MLVTQDGHVWDQSGSSFDLIYHKLTLQEWTESNVTYKWTNLRAQYRPNEKRLDGVILRDEDEDWLIFMVAEGKALNQSLTDSSRHSIYPKFDFLGTENSQLVSSVPAKGVYLLANSTFRKELCLYQFIISTERTGWFKPKTQKVASK